MSLPVIFLMGATATGKTDVAVSLFERYSFDIISVDSAMVYRGMDIGSGKPSKDLLKSVPHRLIDICEPYEIYSVSQFRQDAMQEIKQIHERQRVPLLVGGTNLYFRALEHGISELPDADQNVRKYLEEKAKKIGWQAMHQRLADIDPISAANIHPNDPQRIQRALEVYEISGRSINAHHQDKTRCSFPFKLIKIILNLGDKVVLRDKIKQRFLKMLDDGLVDEVKAFYNDDRIDSTLPSMRMIGYRQVWDYLDGQISYQDMLDKAVITSRRLAKRQMTWLRKEINGIWLNCDAVGIHKAIKEVFTII